MAVGPPEAEAAAAPRQCPEGLRTCPWASTMIRSEPRTVCRRWAIVSMVQSAKASRMVSWISKSVSVSIAAVASSKIRIYPAKPKGRREPINSLCALLSAALVVILYYLVSTQIHKSPILLRTDTTHICLDFHKRRHMQSWLCETQ